MVTGCRTRFPSRCDKAPSVEEALRSRFPPWRDLLLPEVLPEAMAKRDNGKHLELASVRPEYLELMRAASYRQRNSSSASKGLQLSGLCRKKSALTQTVGFGSALQ